MSAVVYVSRDSGALAVAADEVATAIVAEAQKRGVEIKIVRNGSRGLYWLEPLVEVETLHGRVAYGPVSVRDVPGLFDAGFLSGTAHPACHGLTEEIPFLKKQTRLTFARCGITDPLSLEDYKAHGGLAGLRAALAMQAGIPEPEVS
jgi:formate dehydrogenase iron-sulfur subunit